MRQRETGTFFLFTLPIYLVLFAILIYPIYFCVKMSLSTWDIGTATGKFTGFEHYSYLLHDPIFWGAIKNVIYISAVAIPLEVVLGFSIALLVNKTFQDRGGFINSLLAIPMVTAPVVAGLFWRWLLDPNLGIINYLLNQVYLQLPSWKSSPFWARNMVAMVAIWKHTPFVILVMYAGLQSLPKDCLEAAIVDGARAFQRLWYVVIPLLKRLFLFVFVIRAADVIKSFDEVYVLTGGGPGSSTETPSMFSYNTAFTYLHMDRGSASGILYLSLSLVFIVLFIRMMYLREKEEF